MRRGLAFPFIVLGVLLGVVLGARPALADLQTGIRQVRDGEFEAALLTLDAVIRETGGRPERSEQASQAYVYLGVAYLGLGQDGLAKSKFRMAVQQQPDLRLSPDEFSAKAIRTFESAREAERAAASVQQQARKSKGKGALILLGAGGAAALGVAAAVTTQERKNRPPTASLSIAPEGQAIARITTLTFLASGADPDGDAVSFSWEFGDGASASGAQTTHLYRAPGDYNAVLTARDGLASARASAPVKARTLTGAWRLTSPGLGGVIEYRIDDEQDMGGHPDFAVRFAGGLSGRVFSATVSSPRSLSVTYYDPRYGGAMGGCPYRLEAQFDAALDTMTGPLRCVIRANCPEFCSPSEVSITANRQ